MNRDEYSLHVNEALRLLGEDRLVLGIHDPAFPVHADEDVGRGSPYTHGAAGFLRFVRALGYDAVQLGPQGLTSRIDPSPYDGTIFSKNVLSAPLRALARDPKWHGLLEPSEVDAIVAGKPENSDRVSYEYVYDAQRRALKRAFWRFLEKRAAGEVPELERAFERYRREQAAWLERDALYEAFTAEHGTDDWRVWPERDRLVWRHDLADAEALRERRRVMAAKHRAEVELFAFTQFVLDEEHRALRARCEALGLRLYGDLQIGISFRDQWSWSGLFLDEFAMGAPPSRTNPAGQAWGYPVLDPRLYFAGDGDGPALRFFRTRIDRALADYDGLRIDHPQGLVCPWVYRTNGRMTEVEALDAVRHGGRLYATPNEPEGVPELRELAGLAIARPEQLDRSQARWSDGWVRTLDDGQVQRFAVLFDALVERLDRAGRGLDDLLCEVLSTFPEPLRRVMERHGLGRFRVTQKADPDAPGDVYRPERADAADWVMVGNHDTPPIRRLAEAWAGTDEGRRRAAYLAAQLAESPSEREALAAALADSPSRLVEAMYASALASPARHVLVFFTDLYGMTEPYNEPGVVDERNWSLRLPSSYRELYRRRLASGHALNLPRVLALALRARHLGDEALLAALDRLGEELRRGLLPDEDDSSVAEAPTSAAS